MTVDELAFLIEKYQSSYYTGEAEISDAEFDALWDELRRRDKDHPLLHRIGSDLESSASPGGNFEKAKHIMPMGSQEKAANPDEFIQWASKVNFSDFLVEYKLDGASLELQYENGLFVKAVTRGDGEIGDDITRNAQQMSGAVTKLLDASGSVMQLNGAVRGEVIMTRDVHKKYFSDKANCRNAANGLMKRKDGSGSSYLQIICYDAFFPDDAPFTDEEEKLAWLNGCGFMTVPVKHCHGSDEVIEYRARVMEDRSSLPYDIDGLVIKGKEIDLDDLKRNRPEKQIAFKFSLEEAVSIVRSVIWSESGSTYTPIAEFDAVELAGTKVQRASLVNPNTIQSLGLKIGSHVVVTKRGEIIPKIEYVLHKDSTLAKEKQIHLFSETDEIIYPSVCTKCGSVVKNEGTRLYCPNPLCPKRIHHRLEKWISVLDIRDFGLTLIRRLFESGRVTSITDIYTLTEEDLIPYFLNSESIGKEKQSLGAKKVALSIHSKKSLTLPVFIAGFDIEGIGETLIEKLSGEGFNTLEKLLSSSAEDFAQVNGFGSITGKTLYEGLKEHREEMLHLVNSGIITLEVPGEGKLTGLSFCFTGELVTMKRLDAEALVKKEGGSVKSSVVKGLSYLVTNDKTSGSSKNKKAQVEGIPIISEQEFLSLAGYSK